MNDSYDDTPSELNDIEARMRGLREEWTPVELDQVKLRAMRARRHENRSAVANRLARKLVALTLAATVGIGGVAVAAGNHGGGTKPGKGCGDKNHYHEQRASC